MRTFYLIRHAQGSLGTDNYDQLSELGFQQAEFLGRCLRAECRFKDAQVRLVRGDLHRHRQTTEAIANQASVDEDLNEYCVDGLLQSAFTVPDALGIELPSEQAIADPRTYLNTFLELFPTVLQAWQEQRLACPMNGQWHTFSQRVLSSARRIEDQIRETSVLAVTSAGVISTITAALLGRNLAWQRKFNVALYNASITELVLDDRDRWHATRLNCIAHLADPGLHTLA